MIVDNLIDNEEVTVKQICQKIFDKKGFNILALDVRGIQLRQTTLSLQKVEVSDMFNLLPTK